MNDPPGPAIITSPSNNIRAKFGTPLNFSAICFDLDVSYGDKLSYFWYSNISDVFGSRQNLNNTRLPVGFHQITVYVFDLADEYCKDSINISIFPLPIEPGNITTNNNLTETETPMQDDDNLTNPNNNDRDSDFSFIVYGSIIIVIVIIIILVFVLIVIKKDIHPIKELKNMVFKPKKDQ
jgi:hypothetical protein